MVSRNAISILASIMAATLLAPTAAAFLFVPNNSVTSRMCHQEERPAEISYIHTSSIHGMNSRRKSIRILNVGVGNAREGMEDDVLLLPLYEAELVKLKGSLVVSVSGGEDSSKEDKKQRIEELTNTIDNARTAAEFGVRRVQADFYDAFSNADYEMMENVWSDNSNSNDDAEADACCSCTHPGMHSLTGIDAIMDSWRQIFTGHDSNSNSNSNSKGDDQKKPFMIIRPSRVKVDICGRTAICTCVEETNGGRLEAMNIYRREEGTWKMVNHMASPIMM